MENISAKGGLESSCHLLPKNVHSKLVIITKKDKENKVSSRGEYPFICRSTFKSSKPASLHVGGCTRVFIVHG